MKCIETIYGNSCYWLGAGYIILAFFLGMLFEKINEYLKQKHLKNK